MNFKIFTLVFLFLISTKTGFAQQTSKLNLYDEVARADSLMFQAFNNCDSLTYKKFIKEDLEFYHDLGGLTVGADNELLSLKRDVCTG